MTTQWQYHGFLYVGICHLFHCSHDYLYCINVDSNSVSNFIRPTDHLLLRLLVGIYF